MRSLFEIACKRCNSNDSNSNCEAVLGELRATLLRRGGGVARVRIPHHARGRIRQNVDSFSHNRLSSPFFTQWVCTLVATPPQTTPTPTKTTPAPPPIGGNCISRAATRRRYTASQLLMLQNPHWPPVWRAWEGVEGLAAVPVGGGGAWPGFETTRRAEGSQRGRLAGGPPPTGTPCSPAGQGIQSSPVYSGSTQQGARSAAAPRAPHVCQWLTG